MFEGLFAAALTAAVVLFVVIVCLVSYLLAAYPLYVMSRNAGLAYPWLAWIPVAQFYNVFTLGGGDFTMFGGSLRIQNRANAFWMYLAVAVGGCILGGIPVLGALISFLASLFDLIAMYRAMRDLFDVFDPDPYADHGALAVFSALISIVFIVALWVYHNRIPDYSRYTSYVESRNVGGTQPGQDYGPQTGQDFNGYQGSQPGQNSGNGPDSFH